MPRRSAHWARWLDELRSLSPAIRIALGAVAAMVIIGAMWLAGREGSGQRVRLIETDRFSAQQLSSMRAAFESAGLRDYSVKAGHVEVPREQSARYLAALAHGSDLPYRVFEEVLQRRDWFTSQGDLDRQWDLATQQFLAQIIREMEGVEKAWVRWAAAAKPGLRRDEDVRASVGVKMTSGRVLSPRIEEAIKDLIVGSRAGLSPENISVVDLSEATTPSAAAGRTDAEQLVRHRQLEQYYTEKLEKLLAFIEGVIVSVNVTLVAPDGALAQPSPIVASQGAVVLRQSNDGSVDDTGRPLSPGPQRSDLLVARLAVTVGLPNEHSSPRTRGQGIGGRPTTEVQGENERIRRLVMAALPTLEEPATVLLHRYRKRETTVEGEVATWIDFGGGSGAQLAAAIALLTSGLLILVVRSAILGRKLRRMAPRAPRDGSAEVPEPHSGQLRGAVESLVRRDTARTMRVLKNWIHEGKQE